VNDQIQIPEVVLTTGAGVVQTVMLRRGKNTITVTATGGHAIPFDAGGRPFSTPVRVQVVEAANLDKNRTKYLNVGDSATIIVVTPPHLLSLPAPE